MSMVAADFVSSLTTPASVDHARDPRFLRGTSRTLGGLGMAQEAAVVSTLADSLEALQLFAREILNASSDGRLAVDAQRIQAWAIELGLLAPITATEPCGPGCVCARVTGFPAPCNRITDSVVGLADASPPSQTQG